MSTSSRRKSATLLGNLPNAPVAVWCLHTITKWVVARKAHLAKSCGGLELFFEFAYISSESPTIIWVKLGIFLYFVHRLCTVFPLITARIPIGQIADPKDHMMHETDTRIGRNSGSTSARPRKVWCTRG